MNRMTAVGLCTCVVLSGCGLGDEPSDRHTGSDLTAEVAAQQVETSERTVHGAVRGTYGETPFTAVATITEFVAEDGAVRAVGALGEISGLGDEARLALARETFDFSVSLGPAIRPQVVVMNDAGAPNPQLGAVCDVLYVRLLPQTRTVEGQPLALEAITLDVEAAPSVDSAVGRALCEASALLEPGGTRGGPTPANVDRAVVLLNEVVRLNQAAVPDGGTLDVPAIDAGVQKPAVSFDASVPIKL